MASTDAKPVPQKNVAYRLYFAIRKNDGTLITTWAGQDTELSGDGGAFADATNEATEIGTSGCGYIDLTAGEMNYDSVIVKVTVTNTDALPYVITLFPEEAGDIRVNATQIEGSDATDQINAACDTALTDYDAATGTELGLVDAKIDVIDNNVDTVILDIGALNDPTAATIAAAVWDELLTGATHNTATSAGKIVRDLQENQGYLGYIWVDTVNGTAGTESYVNGTVNNPVDSWGDALTLSAAVGLTNFQIGTGSSITLTASVDGYGFYGNAWVCTLNGQSCSGAYFQNAVILGNDDGSNTSATVYDGCRMSDNTLGYHRCSNCGLFGTVTLSEAASYGYIRCHTSRPTGTAPVIDFGAAVGNTNLNMVDYTGQIELRNIGATGTDTFGIGGIGEVTFASSCVGGTAYIAGNMLFINNSTGMTINQDARIDIGQINAACDTAISDATFFDPAADEVETGMTYKHTLQDILASTTGKTTTNGSVFRDAADTKDRLTYTIDGNKNRTAVTRSHD